MNPNGRVPTLVDGDFVLWESNSVMRYLALTYGPGSTIYPKSPKVRAGVDRWLDWTLSTLQPVDRPVFWALVRTPPAQRDMVAIQKDADAEAVQWRIVDAYLATRRFIEGDDFTIADIALGAYARRWFGVEGISKPTAASRSMVRAIRRPRRICAVHRAADVVSGYPGGDQMPERSNSKTTDDHDQRDGRRHQPPGPAHAAADPPQQRAAHDHGNDDIQSQWTLRCPGQRPPLEVPTPMATLPPIWTQVSLPSTLTKPSPYAAQALPAPAPFNGSCRPEVAGLSRLLTAGCLGHGGRGRPHREGDRKQDVSHPVFYCVRRGKATGRT